MKRENEFREKLAEKELTNFSKIIRELSDEKIDKLWYLCSFIISDREEKFKAITQEYIDKIKKSLSSPHLERCGLFRTSGCSEMRHSEGCGFNHISDIRKNLASAKEVVWSLIAETPVKEFTKNLSKVEKYIL